MVFLNFLKISRPLKFSIQYNVTIYINMHITKSIITCILLKKSKEKERIHILLLHTKINTYCIPILIIIPTYVACYHLLTTERGVCYVR